MDLIRMSQRYCDQFPNCSDCPENSDFDSCLVAFIASMTQDPEKVIGRVMDWNKKNPDTTTYSEHFFSIFPSAGHAKVDGRTVPTICIQKFYPHIPCRNNCLSCWNQPMPELEKPRGVKV